MELVQCIENVYAHPSEWLEADQKRILFKKGHVYPVFLDPPYWLTQDEEGERHIIADDDGRDLETDPWFSVHFRAL
ncbi:MAG TPA: hypothetical protein VFK33_00640 [Bacillales bacterium]|nr:hypothetical protein [Bacillales bacterium]